MKSSFCIVVVSFAATLPITPLAAQACAGAASFAAGQLRVEAQARFGNRQSSIGGGVSAGVHNSFFAGLGIQRTYHDSVVSPSSIYAVQPPSTDYAVNAGYQIAPAATDRLQICPTVRYDHTSAVLRDPTTILTHVTGDLVAFAVAAGGVASHSETVDFVPAISVEYGSLHSRVRQDAPFSATIDERSENHFWTGTITAGLVLNRVVSLCPNVVVPFGIANASATYGIAIGFNFGRH